MKLNRRQRVVLSLGVTALLFFFLFPPWNFGSVRLPYQVKWPPQTPPITGITSYAPFSMVIEAPTLDEEAMEAVNKEAAKSLDVPNDADPYAQSAAIFHKLHIDWQRLALMQAVIMSATTALLVAFKQRRT